MSNVKKNPALLYLGRFQAEYFAEGSNQSIRFPFSPEVVRDLEVINPAALLEQTKAFVTQYKIVPAELTFLLADDILFSKTITLPDPKSREDAVQTFIDSVPFEETGVVQVPFQGSVSVSVANKAYYGGFQKAFEPLGFPVELIIPAFLLNKEVNLAKSSDVASFAHALKRAGTYRQYSLLSQVVTNQPSTVTSGTGQGLKRNKRLLILVGVFGVLIVLLIGVYAMTRPPEQPIDTQNASGGNSPTVAAEPVVTSTEVLLQGLKIVYQPESIVQVNQVIPLLQGLGVMSISSESATIATSSASVLLFSPTVPEDRRGVVVSEVQKVIPTLTVVEGDTASDEAVLMIN